MQQDEANQYNTSQKLAARADLFARFGKSGGGWQAWVFDHLIAADLPGDARIADIGGGPGWLWQQNQSRIPAGWQVLHTDASPGMVAEARANIGRPGSSFGVVDAQWLPFQDGSLDALLANHMLYHVPDRARALREFARVLKPGASLLATTNGEAHMAEIPALIEAFNHRHGNSLAAWPKLSFTLESGASELERYFAHVELRRCLPGVLRVTEAEPLAACICSVGTPDAPTRTKLLDYLRSTVSAERAVLLRTQSGVFVART